MDQMQELEALIQEGNFSEALDRIDAMPQDERSRWQILNLTGIICLCCGQLEQAETFFKDALEQEPDDPELLYNLAECCVCLGKYRRAEDLLCRCEQVGGDDTIEEDVAALRERISSAEGGRVLMVAYYFPPLSGSGVFRSLKFAKYLPQFDWHPTVISTDRPPDSWNFSDESLTAEIPADMEVIRIPDLISTMRGNSLSGERVQTLLQFLHDFLQSSAEADQIFSQFAESREGTIKLLTFPCGALSWAYDTVQYIEKNIDLDKFRVIYTTSGPNSAHLIGFYMKQKYGIPWVADYRDPWTFNAYDAAYDATNPSKKLLFELESILLRQADCNLTVVDGLTEMYERQFGLPKERIVSITNGYDEGDFSALPVPEKQTEKFTINYSGLLYSQQRDVTPALKALQQLVKRQKVDPEKILLRIVGTSVGSSNQEYLGTLKRQGQGLNIVYTGYVSHREALQANLDANLLLLLVGDEEKFKSVFTGKIFEYLRSGRPILALAPKGSVVDQILRESGHGQAFLSTQINQIKDMILREYRKWEKGQDSALLHSPVIERFERKVLTEQLANVLSDAVRQRNPLPILGSGTPVNRGPKYLVICNGGYPTEGNPRCMFAHKRVLQYIKAGLNIETFGFIWNAPFDQYEYEGVKVVQGGVEILQRLLQSEAYEKLIIHFADNAVMYAIQQAGKLDTPMIIWCHGYDVMKWNRTYFNYSQKLIAENKSTWDKNDAAKKQLFKQLFSMDHIHFVFVSHWIKERIKRSIGQLPLHYHIIPNYIDCDFYEMSEKCEEDRTKILSIKSHSSRVYANDLTEKAILELSDKDYFSKLEFELYGSGPLFEQNFGELRKRNFPNVHLHKTFLSAKEMREKFIRNGIFLSPTRLDSQGVVAGEAMSAGLAVISCNTAAVPEFIDEDCGSLYEFDNYFQLADEIEYLYYHPEEFLRKARNGVRRVREQCGYDATIKKEIQLITSGLPHRSADDGKLDELASRFLMKNYNYIWLKAMLQKGRSFAGEGASIITGSSYGVNGIVEHQWNYAVNCSVSSQDLYYDFLCARYILANNKRSFSKCFVLGSYYSACHDLSRGVQERELMISNVYYPIFKDAHNWESPCTNDLWAEIGSLSGEEKALCEARAIEKILEQGTYFSDAKKRGGTIFDLNGRQWWEVPSEERMALGKIRAEAHNKLFWDGQTNIAENKKILREYVQFLHLNNILPIFVIPPFTEEYNRYISSEMKESVLDLLASVPEEIRFIDFNQFSCFEAADFVDTDHLSKAGAEKFSRLLVEGFGK